MMFIKLLKALCILGVVLFQYLIVILNLNRFGPFQSFVEIEWYEKSPKQENTLHDDQYDNLFI